MANEEIIEGLRNALFRGYSLEQAMMSFYNAGYKKEEVEEAARTLHESLPNQLSPQQKIPLKQEKSIAKTSPYISSSSAPLETKLPEPKPEEKQIISKYEERTNPKGKLTLILLLISLFIFILILIGGFIFRKELIDFFKTLF